MSKYPRLLFIMADGDTTNIMSCYGKGINQTPHSDRLAKEDCHWRDDP